MERVSHLTVDGAAEAHRLVVGVVVLREHGARLVHDRQDGVVEAVEVGGDVVRHAGARGQRVADVLPALVHGAGHGAPVVADGRAAVGRALLRGGRRREQQPESEGEGAHPGR